MSWMNGLLWPSCSSYENSLILLILWIVLQINFFWIFDDGRNSKIILLIFGNKYTVPFIRYFKSQIQFSASINRTYPNHCLGLSDHCHGQFSIDFYRVFRIVSAHIRRLCQLFQNADVVYNSHHRHLCQIIFCPRFAR